MGTKMPERPRNHHRGNHYRLLDIAVITLTFALFGLIDSARAQAGQAAPADPREIKVHPMPTTAIRLPVEGKLPSLGNATAG
jgi:hypothetical protein